MLRPTHAQTPGKTYVVLLYEDSTYRPAPAGHAAERVAVLARWADSLDTLGKFERAGRLIGPGPLGGLFMIRAADDADAARIAASCPFKQWGGHVESNVSSTERRHAVGPEAADAELPRRRCAMIARTLCVSFAVSVAFPIAAGAQTDTSAAPSSHMADLDQYLMPRDSEIAFARTAAPPALSRDAKVLVLTAHGYEPACPAPTGSSASWRGPGTSP